MCTNSTSVYKVKCNNTGKVCTGNAQQKFKARMQHDFIEVVKLVKLGKKLDLGNTQQKFKNRMQQHFNEIQKLVKLGEKSDSYAKHFATQFHETNPSPTNQREGTTCSIIWQGNPISVVKTFATKNCALCAKERLEILKQSRSNPQLTSYQLQQQNLLCL